MLEIFELSRIKNVEENSHQLNKFLKYPIKRIIGVQYKDIWPTVHTNTENTILHINHNFDLLKSTFSCEFYFFPQNIRIRQNAGIFIDNIFVVFGGHVIRRDLAFH
jgi:hypothetical protein